MVKQLLTHQRFSFQGVFIRCLDGLLVGCAFILAHKIYGGNAVPLYDRAGLTLAVMFVLIANVFGVYSSQDKGIRTLGYGTLVLAWFVMLAAMLLLAYATKTSSSFSRVSVASWIIITPVILVLSRALLKWIGSFYSWGERTRVVAIAGYGENARRFIDKLQELPGVPFEIAGIYTSEADNDLLQQHNHVPQQGMLDSLVSDVKQGKYDEVYIALSMNEEEKIADLISELSDCSVPVYFIPDVFTMNLMVSKVYHLKGVPVISVYDTQMDNLDVFVKRAEDLLLGSVILLLIMFPMLVIAVAIKLTSKGAVIFKQHRYGLGGESIEVWKFRSMTVCDDGDVVVQAKKNDARITKLGVFLRKTSLDELPQFINVLMGDMSIVGPRPHAVAHNELYRKDIQGYMLRHLVKPGITGWAQVNGWRGETDTIEKMEARVEHDLEYIKNWSLSFDLKIIAMTVFKGFTSKNAY